MTEHPIPFALRAYPAELVLITAPTREDVVRRAEVLRAGLAASPERPLRDFAWTMVRDADPTQPCLAVIAESVADLDTKLDQAVARLTDPACAGIHDQRGIYFTSDRLASRGKIAWMFPGEGAQYPGMLRDLCLHVPEVRAHYDLIDEAAAGEDPDFVPSRIVFPPPGSSPGEDRADLHAWNAAVMAVIGANTALMELFRALDVPADATVGHSFGEFTALELAGVLRDGDTRRLPLTRLACRQIREISTFADIPEAVLLNVGGAERSVIDHQIARHRGALAIAMANCPLQYILCATGPDRARVAESTVAALVEEGALCAVLPFDRPYHTPHFAPAMKVERRFYDEAGVHPPTRDVYSCCSADRFPDDAAGIIDLATLHWARPIRFQDTIERMYADGVRIFLEVGPRGNLSAFVADILRERPHVAVPVDRERSGTLVQLQKALGILAAHGVPMRLDRLHRDRGSEVLEPDTWKPPAPKKRSHTVPTGAQAPQLDAAGYTEEFGTLSDRLRPAPAAAGEIAAAAALVAPPAPAPGPVGEDPVVAAYLENMSRFLATQDEIGRSLVALAAGGTTVPHATVRAPSPAPMPAAGPAPGYGPGPGPGPGMTRPGPIRTSGSADQAQAAGLETDRRIPLPEALREALHPSTAMLSEIWTPPAEVAETLRGNCIFARVRDVPPALLLGNSGLYLRRWADEVLSPGERRRWNTLDRSADGLVRWLAGRTAAKDAVRKLVEGRSPGLAAAAVVLTEEKSGKPVLQGNRPGGLTSPPAISIAHTAGIAVAVAGDHPGSRIGIDVEGIREPGDNLREATLAPDEATLVPRTDEWFFRVWAAKEAFAKALGTGVIPDPKRLAVRRLDIGTGAVELHAAGESAVVRTCLLEGGNPGEKLALAVCQC